MNKFIPNNYKYKKIHKNVRIIKTQDYKSSELKEFDFGLKVLDFGVISSTVLEAARRSITRKIKRIGIVRINGFANVPITSKPLNVRMGKGVGNISGWVFPVKKGRLLFELKNVPFDLAKSALKSAAFKLPIKTKFVFK